MPRLSTPGRGCSGFPKPRCGSPAVADRTTGLLLGLLCASHPYVLEWSREARAYMLEMLLTTLCLVGWIGFEQASREPRAGRLLTLAGSLLVVTHVFGVFVVAGMAMYLLASSIGRSSLRANVASMWQGVRPLVIPLQLAIVWAIAMHVRIDHNLDDFWIRDPIGQTYLTVAATVLPWTIVTAPLVALGFGTLICSRGIRRRMAVMCLVTVAAVSLGPLAASMLSRGGHHFVLPRYFLPLVPLVILPIGLLFTRFERGRGVVGVVALGAVWLSTADFDRLYGSVGPNGDVKAAAQFLIDHCDPDDEVRVWPHYQVVTLAYYGADRACRLKGTTTTDLRRVLDRDGGATHWTAIFEPGAIGIASDEIPPDRFIVHEFPEILILEPKSQRQ